MKFQIIFLFCIPLILSWKPKFIGHRGSIRGVENTAEAFINGVDYFHFDGLECDIHVTKDKHYVINHDGNINGTKGYMKIEEHTLAELKSNKLTQKRKNVTYHGEICTLEEYLKICADKKVFPVIEIKKTTGMSGKDMKLFPGLLDLVKKYNLEKKAYFISFMQDSVEYIRKNYDYLKVQFLMDTLNDERARFCQKYKVNASIAMKGVSTKVTDRMHKLGLFVGIWTCDGMSLYDKYAPMGVYTFTSNELMVNKTKDYPKRWPDLPDDAVEEGDNTKFMELE